MPNKYKILSKQTRKIIISTLIFLISFDLVLYPLPILASKNEEKINSEEDHKIDQTETQSDGALKEGIELTKDQDKANIVQLADLKTSTNTKIALTATKKAAKTGFYSLSAYNSEVAQCDSTPCITANGFNVCKHGVEDTVAANFLPFGTKIKIPEIFGERVFVVRDRMNSRYQKHIDIWFKDKGKALKFGRKTAKVEILGI